MNSRGISSPLVYLRQNGLTRFQIHRLMHKDWRSISMDVLEKLCLALNCTPNDLLEWTPDFANQDAESTTLRMLKPQPENENMGAMLSQLPYNKLREIVKIVNEIPKQERKQP